MSRLPQAAAVALASLGLAACAHPLSHSASQRAVVAAETVTIDVVEMNGVQVTRYTPRGWTVRQPTIIFSSGAGVPDSEYACYGHLWAEQGLRTMMPTFVVDLSGYLGRQQRWRQLSAVYAGVVARQDRRRVVLAGHSAGAYVTLLAAGADSRLRGDSLDNCTGQGCTPLAAAGYVIISGQPAQSAEADAPFWFARNAFAHLAPNLLVAYGARDYVPRDPCMTHEGTPPSCRGDAFTVVHDRARTDRSTLRVVEEFAHGDFICTGARQSRRELPLREFVVDVGSWIRQVTAAPGLRRPGSR